MRAVITYGEGQYANILGNRLERDDSLLLVYNDDKLTGIFDIGVINTAHLSAERKDELNVSGN